MRGRNRFLPLLLRVAGAIAMIGTLTGGLSVSCAGDSTPASGGGGSNAPNSASMGQWTPATQDTCTKAFHDTFFVVGPDGKKYPTWHPTVETDPTTKQLCSFGHEHGLDPRDSVLWEDLQRHFAFDANQNGTIELSELTLAGIPFGLVSEKLQGTSTPRLEDHTGYKIIHQGNVSRAAISGAPAGGLDLSCDLFEAYNQPTSTADGFASNMFSVTYAIDCPRGTTAQQMPLKAFVSVMAVYGNPGSLTLPNGAQLDGTGAPVPAQSPNGEGELGRKVPVSDDVLAGAFVVAGGTSSLSALSERWETKLRIRRADATFIAQLAPAFRVDETARYFSGGSVAQTVDLCYSGLNAAGDLVSLPALAPTIVRQVRNNARCSAIAPNGPGTQPAERVAFDDPDSPFKSCRRTGFFGADSITNGGGPTIWYTDAFGGNASTTLSSTSSIRQFIASTATNALVMAEVGASQSSCASAQVHLPN